MCGAEADSSEHRLKKSDIVRAYGRGPYSGDTQPIHFRDKTSTKVQGPNSRAIKYANILCIQCNTTNSQPYDKAYETFIEWITHNEGLVLHQRFIDFERVFGADWEDRQRNLYKYFAKSFGCRLAEISRAVPDDVVNLFDKKRFRTGLRLTFAVNEDIVLMPPRDRNGFIGKGTLNAMVQRTNTSIVNGYTWDEHVSWFTTMYWYIEWPDGNLGSSWVADSKHIYLGSHSPLPPEMRSEFMQKLALRIGERAP